MSKWLIQHLHVDVAPRRMSISQCGNLTGNRARVALPAEEDLEKRDVECSIQVAQVMLLSQPSRERRPTGAAYAVNMLVGPVSLLNQATARQTTLDESWQDGIELRLRRLPDVADRRRDALSNLVSRDWSSDVTKHAEHGVIGNRETSFQGQFTFE
jgi:hypothetical protein